MDTRPGYAVLTTVLDSGERLPCLVDSTSWLPVRAVTRWAVRYRRYRVQFSTLSSNLRVLGHLYQWSQDMGCFDLDDFLVRGKILQNRQLESLAAYLRTRSGRTLGDTGAFDQQLAVIEDFLKWALDSHNRGGCGTLSMDRLAAERAALEQTFRSLRIGAKPSSRIQPLEEDEIKIIRRVIGPATPTHQPVQELLFPAAFSSRTRLRNWLMFEVALELGVRRGELLKLRLDSLPRGPEDGIRILRRPDDPHDSRVREPAVKTAERVLPASRNLLSAIRAYLTSPAPMGRVSGKSPYLFVTGTGDPVSVDTADDIIVAAGRHSGVRLSWHRLRHSWAERMAEALAEQPNGMDRLVYLGGWTNPLSARRYIQRAIARQAAESMRAYQRTLYREQD